MAEPHRHLVAVDWGTTSLRAALVDPAGRILDRRAGPDGIMAMAGRSYPEILSALIAGWRDAHPEAPILLSGMVGSRQGWVEAPYVPCPASLADLAASVVGVAAGGLGEVGIVPGVVDTEGTSPDVMRGEEVQIAGALLAAGSPDGLFVLPGTHSKWARVEAGRIVHFHTFMTGELYALLRHQSILGRLMPAADPDAPDHDAFDRGCAAASGAILNRLFSARTLGLFGQVAPDALPSYLSGLLVGEEVREGLVLSGTPPSDVIDVVGRTDLATLYARCLATMGIATRLNEDAAFQGLFAIARCGGMMA